MDWYTTAGYPGGEYAIHAPSHTHALAILIHYDKFHWHPDDLQRFIAYLRTAPPELAEWLDMFTGEMIKDGHGLPVGGYWQGPDQRRLVPGGYLVFGEFVPVGGAAGITVIGETDERS